MTRADAEELSILRCIQAGHNTQMALLAQLGLSPFYASVLDKVLTGLAQRGLLNHDGISLVMSDDGFARLNALGK